MKTPKLIPCPFCGNTKLGYTSGIVVCVYCQECGCYGPPAYKFSPKVIDPITLATILWNNASCGIDDVDVGFIGISKNGCPCCGKNKWLMFDGYNNYELEPVENGELAVDLVLEYENEDEEYDIVEGIIVDLCLTCGTTISNYAVADGAYLTDEVENENW